MTQIISSAQLTTPATKLGRTKYHPVELYCTNMIPGTQYNAYYDGVLVNAFCKPFGGNLGDNLLSSAQGKLTILFLMSISYNPKYLVVPTNTNNSNSNIYVQNKQFQLIDAFGRSSITYIPTVLKAT